MINRPALSSAELAFTDADFQTISRYAAQRYGLDIKIEKKGLIYARLARRVRALGLPDFKSYCDFATSLSAAGEQEELLSALTTNVSSFFREKHHFEFLKRTVLPSLRQKAESKHGISIWSAGCSSGQEPYSIAATLHDTWPDLDQLKVEVLATDVDPRILEKARTAIYRETEVSTLSHQQQQLLFEPSNAQSLTVKVRPAIRRLVTFNQINLVGDWAHPKPFDIIFCRNVVIYFERSTQHRLWQRFSDTISATGHLFIGHSERLSGPAASNFANVGITSFIKCAH